MRRILCVVMFAAVAASILWSADFQWQGQLTPGQLLEIRGLHGSIVAVGGSGKTATVTATKTGSASDVNDVRIIAVPYEGGIEICAIYPDSPNSKHPNVCNPSGMDIYLSANNNDARIDFTVMVPEGVRFSANTLDGNVQATRLSGHVEAHTLKGDVAVSTSTSAEASTLHGSINAVIGSTTWSGTQTLDAGNGNLDLQLPSDANADVHATAFLGAIISEFPQITVTSAKHGNSSMASGALGSGGRSLRLFAFHGNITIHQGPASSR